MKSIAPAPGLFPLPVVVLVEPDADTRELYSLMLSNVVNDIQEFEDGRIALAKTLAEPPDLVVTDTYVPFIDGYALCQLLRQDPATANVPVVMTTSDGGAASVARGYHAGANAVLAKPFLADAFIATIQRAVEADATPQSRAKRGPTDHRVLSLQSVDRARSRMMSHTHARYETSTPPRLPPPLRCPTCDRLLSYVRSHIGGVTARNPEQWDHFDCPTGCGSFDYRHRTRQLRQRP